MNEPTVTVFRLVTGEDIIADATHIEEAGNDRYVIYDPLKIVYLPTTAGTHLSISLMQWLFLRISEKQEFEIKAYNVLFTTEPTEDLTDYYYKTVEHFYQVKKKSKGGPKLSESDNVSYERAVYEDAAMSDEEIDDLLDSEEMRKVKAFLEELVKKDKGTLH